MTLHFDDDWTDVNDETRSGGALTTASFSDYASEAQREKMRWLLETPVESVGDELASYVRSILPPDLRLASFYQAARLFFRDRWLDRASFDPTISTVAVAAKLHDVQSLAKKQIQEEHFLEFMAKPEQELADEAIAFVFDRVRQDAPAWVVWFMSNHLECSRLPMSFDFFLPSDLPGDVLAKVGRVNFLVRRTLRDRLLGREREMLPSLVGDYGKWAHDANVSSVTPESVTSFIAARGLKLAPSTRGLLFDRLAYAPK